MASYQSTWPQSSHEDSGPSVGRLTPRPPDPSATFRNSELAEAEVCRSWHCVSRQGAVAHRAPSCFKGDEERKTNSKGLIATFLSLDRLFGISISHMFKVINLQLCRNVLSA